MTMFPNRRPANRPSSPTPAMLDDPPLSELKEWWYNVKRFQTQEYFKLENSDQILGVQIRDEVIARKTEDEILATEIESIVVVIGTKSTIYVQGSAPASPVINDLWLDTSDQNKYKFWDGAVWQYKQDLVLAAAVSTESSVRATADGFLSGKYTLTVAAGNVVTGMNITSSTGGGTDISDVTFVATNFKIYNGTTGITMFNVSGSNVNLANTLTVSTSGKIFSGVGTYANNNTPFYVDNASQFSLGAGLTWDGATLTVNGSGTFSGSITSSSGTIGGFTIGATTLTAGSGSTFINLNSAGSVFLGVADGSHPYSYLTPGSIKVAGYSPNYWIDLVGTSGKIEGGDWTYSGSYNYSILGTLNFIGGTSFMSGVFQVKNSIGTSTNIILDGGNGVVTCSAVKYSAFPSNVFSFEWDGSNVKVYVDGTVQGTIPNP